KRLNHSLGALEQGETGPEQFPAACPPARCWACLRLVLFNEPQHWRPRLRSSILLIGLWTSRLAHHLQSCCSSGRRKTTRRTRPTRKPGKAKHESYYYIIIAPRCVSGRS